MPQAAGKKYSNMELLSKSRWQRLRSFHSNLQTHTPEPSALV